MCTDRFLDGIEWYELMLWAAAGAILWAKFLLPAAPLSQGLVLWFFWNLPVILWMLTDWLREWPTGLLDAKKDMEEVKAALVRAERLRLGGRSGGWCFFGLAWLSVLALFSAIPQYGYASWLAFSGRPPTSMALVKDAWFAGFLAVSWAGWFLWVRRYRGLSDFGRIRGGRPSPWAEYAYPTPEFMLRSPEEAAAFLSEFARACPLPDLETSAYLSRTWKLAPSIALYAFHFFTGVLGLAKGVLPFLDAVSAVLLGLLALSIVPWLYQETGQWRYADDIRCCAYRPLLRLVRYARRMRG